MSRGDGNPSVPSNSPSTWLELYQSGLALGLRPNEFWELTFMEFIAYTAGFRDTDRRMWNHTSSVLATIANVNRDRKRQPKAYTPADFNPYENEHDQSRELTEQDIQNIASWRVNP